MYRQKAPLPYKQVLAEYVKELAAQGYSTAGNGMRRSLTLPLSTLEACW
jgi:hypothetical protein